MHLDINDYNQNQIKAALAANIQTAIALWEAKDWQTYKSMRDVLLALIRSGRGDEVGLEQMQFIYFIGTHLRDRLPSRMPDWRAFTAELPASRPAGDKAWKIATEGAFWNTVL